MEVENLNKLYEKNLDEKFIHRKVKDDEIAIRKLHLWIFAKFFLEYPYKYTKELKWTKSILQKLFILTYM